MPLQAHYVVRIQAEPCRYVREEGLCWGFMRREARWKEWDAEEVLYAMVRVQRNRWVCLLGTLALYLVHSCDQRHWQCAR